MNSIPTQLYIFFAIMAVILAVVGFYYLFTSSTSPLNTGTDLAPPPPAQQAGPYQPQEPAFQVRIKNKNTVIVEWNNLPGDATQINLFRMKKGNQFWGFWKGFTGVGTSGSAEITLGSGENANNYSYYAQGVTGGGTSTWVSPVSSATTSTESILPPPPPPGGGGSGGSGGNPPPPAGNPPPPPPVTPPPSGNPPPPVTPPPGQPLPPSVFPEEHFWVRYVNKKIEIGWQSLPIGTDEIVVYRSPNSSGPYSQLLAQLRPVTSTPSTIQILDDSITSTNYYKLDAKNQGDVFGTYGPVALPPLGQ